nr:hypothetical protein Itr_chr05CG24340 [Ipomoea trifida]
MGLIIKIISPTATHHETARNMAKMAQPWILPPGSDTSNTQRQTICAGSDTITDTASVLIRQLIVLLMTNATTFQHDNMKASE